MTLVVLLSTAACGGSDGGGDGERTAASSTTLTTAATSTSESTLGDGGGGATSSTSSTTAGDGFEGRTTPTSAPAPSGTDAALLSAVRVTGERGFDRVVFEFTDDQLPGYDIAYLDGPARQDGSGEEVPVAGEALLEVRLAPASGVNLLDGTFEQTYTGPDRVHGDTGVVTEVVRIGDFEANLTWVIGLDDEAAYRVEVLRDPPRIVIDLATT